MSTIQDGTQEANKLLRNEEPQLFQPDVYRDPQLEFVKGRQPSAGFVDKVDAAISQLSPTINLADRNDLAVARETSTQVDVPDEALVFGLPKEFQIAVLDEKAKHGSTAALTLSDQIKQDINNNTVMDNLDWYAQLGYSMIGFLADPTTFVAGAGAVKVGANLSTVASKAAPMLGASMPRTAGVLTEWGVVGGIESATLNAPRLGGDHTYKLENYYTDIVVDALLGAGLTYGISKAVNKAGQLQEQVRNRESATAERMQMMERELETAGQTTEPSDFDADDVLSGKRKTLQEVEAGTKQTGGMRHDPRVKIDNDTQWLATQADSLRKQVEEVNKFRRFIDTSELMNHPAYQKPTATNIADLNAKLQAKLSQARAITDSQQPKPVSVGKEKKLSELMHTKSATSTKFLSIMFDNLNTAAMKKADNWKSSPVANVAEPALTRLETLEAAVREAGASPFKKQFEFRLKELVNSMSAKASEKEAVKYARDIDAFVDEWSSVSSPRIDSNGGSSLGSQMSTTIGKIDDEAARLLESRNELLDKRNREQPNISAEQQWQTKGQYATEVKPSEVSFEAKAAQAKVEAQAKQWGISKKVQARHKVAKTPQQDWVGDKPNILLDDYPEVTAELKVLSKQDVNDVAAAVAQQQKALDTDTVSIAELDEQLQAMREVQHKHKDNEEAPSSKVDINTNQLASAEDSVDAAIADPAVAETVSQRMLKASKSKLTEVVAGYHGSGEHKVYRDLLTPSNIKQMAARAVSQWGGITQDLATRFIESKSPTVNWVGTHLTEMGRGYGGDVMRKHTAGVIREAEYIKSISMIMPDYDKAVKEYAASLGSNKVGEMMAAVSVGGQNKVQEAFARKFMKYMNDTRRGRPIDDPKMAEFAAKWNEYMRHNYKQLEQNNIAGFTGDNRRNNYVPQVWQVKHAQRLLRDPLQAQDMKTLLTKATGDAEKADQLIEWLGQQDVATYDGYVATNDARAIARMEVDWSVEHNGMSVLDLLETDTRKLSTSYSNRVAGWVGVSKSTNGALRSYTDINALKLMAYQESDSIKDVELLEDVVDMLFGRQVQGGLPDYARSIKAATVLTRLGGLGSAQLIESGTAATRAIMESAGDPKFMKKLVKGMSPKETAQDLLEIQKMTGNDWDYHLINSEAEYYTEYDLADTGKLQNSVDKAVDVATGGHFKQLAGRAFGHVTGYNQVRRFQSAMVQRSFAMQVARMFKHGDSKMSVQRAADYGLVDAQGRNESLQAAIEQHVEFDVDGYPTKYNFDKWEPEAKDTFMYSLQRVEATELMRPLVGEMPAWFNKPWMQMLMQFRTMPLVAQNKALGRSLAFADKEAVIQLALNTMTAGLVRYGKYAGLAAIAAGTGAKFEEEYQRKVDQAGRDSILGGAVDRYITQGGMYSDMYALTLIGGSANSPQQYLERAMQQVPAMGLVKDYAMGAYAVGEQDGDKALRHVTGVIPLNNTLAFEAAEAVITETIGD